MQVIGSGENTIGVKRAESGSLRTGKILLFIGDEVVALSIRDAKDLAAEINRIVRTPRRAR